MLEANNKIKLEDIINGCVSLNQQDSVKYNFVSLIPSEIVFQNVSTPNKTLNEF